MIPDYLAIEFVATLCSFVLVAAVVSWHLNRIGKRLDLQRQRQDKWNHLTELQMNILMDQLNHVGGIVLTDQEAIRSLITNMGYELKGEIIHGRHKRARGEGGKYVKKDKSGA